MRKGKVLGLAVLIMGLLSGCEKFEPEETAISVDNKKSLSKNCFIVIDPPLKLKIKSLWFFFLLKQRRWLSGLGH